MYEYISGKIAELNPAFVVIDNHGIGYVMNISLTTYDSLSRLKADDVARLYVHEVLREDVHLMYGFYTIQERSLYLSLIGVSGVGPNTARMILSSGSVEQLENAIASGDVSMLKSVKGVGAKTAQRIIVDLKDKIKVPGSTLIQETGQATGHTFDEALAALTMLGFTQAMSVKALKKVFQQQPDIAVEQAIKQALKQM